MDFLPSRVGVVDTVGSNIFVRGPEPLDRHTHAFSYTELAKTLKLDLAKYQLLDICLIDNVGERKHWTDEMVAFGQNPDTFPSSCWPPYINVQNWDPSKGYGLSVKGDDGKSHPGVWRWWPIEGLAPEQDPAAFVTAPGWDLNGVVMLVRSLLGMGSHRLIYVHCAHGCDRTGAVVGGYYMKYQGLNYAETLAKVTAGTPDKVEPNLDYQLLLQAYLTWLGAGGRK